MLEIEIPVHVNLTASGNKPDSDSGKTTIMILSNDLVIGQVSTYFWLCSVSIYFHIIE